MGARLLRLNRTALYRPLSPPLGNGVTQDFKAAVGQVMNAEQMVFNNYELGAGAATGGGQLSEREERVITFIDRTPQSRELSDRLSGLRNEEPYALLVILPGCSKDLHGGFVLRWAYKELEARYGTEPPWRYLKRLRWPQGGKSSHDVIGSIAEGLSLKIGVELSEVETYISKSAAHLCFSHVVEGDDWQIDNGQLIQHWVEYFAEARLTRPNQRNVIAFLCVHLRVERTSSCLALEKFVEGLRQKYSDDKAKVLVTKPLEKIKQRDLEDWLGEAGRYLRDDLIESRLLGLPAEVFERESPRYLHDVHVAVRERLLALATIRPRFEVHATP